MHAGNGPITSQKRSLLSNQEPSWAKNFLSHIEFCEEGAAFCKTNLGTFCELTLGVLILHGNNPLLSTAWETARHWWPHFLMYYIWWCMLRLYNKLPMMTFATESHRVTWPNTEFIIGDCQCDSWSIYSKKAMVGSLQNNQEIHDDAHSAKDIEHAF